MQIKDLYRIKIDVDQVEIVVTDRQEFFVNLTERQLGEIHRNFETKNTATFSKRFLRGSGTKRSATSLIRPNFLTKPCFVAVKSHPPW